MTETVQQIKNIQIGLFLVCCSRIRWFWRILNMKMNKRKPHEEDCVLTSMRRFICMLPHVIQKMLFTSECFRAKVTTMGSFTGMPIIFAFFIILKFKISGIFEHTTKYDWWSVPCDWSIFHKSHTGRDFRLYESVDD